MGIQNSKLFIQN